MLPTVLLLASTVVLSSAFLSSLEYTEYNPNNCTATDFKCRDNHCIAKDKRCDGANDCGDFSDEKDCDFYLCKEPKFFRCKNHRCIAKSFVCDKKNDCEDRSDEVDCEYLKVQHVAVNPTCVKGQWQCTDKRCIPEAWVCDQEIDCRDGSDEGIGCSVKANDCDGFRCKNNTSSCIPIQWRCDGDADCSDNTDEMNCEPNFDRTQCTFDQKKYLCHDNKACIDLKNVCDGNNDCFDKSDEGGLCKHSVANCARHGCSHECVQLPTGPRCICPSGYHNVDEKTCVDINEREEYNTPDTHNRNIDPKNKTLEKTHSDELSRARFELIRREKEQMEELHKVHMEEANFRKEAARLEMLTQEAKLKQILNTVN